MPQAGGSKDRCRSCRPVMLFPGLARPRRPARTVLAPFALGYFLSYLFRAVNAVVGPDLAADIGLSATALGPPDLGLSVRLRPVPAAVGRAARPLRAAPRPDRRCSRCAGAASLLFSIGEDIATLTVARALIGLGFAGGLMSGFKAVVLWVPTSRRALANAVHHVVRRAGHPGRHGAGRTRPAGGRLAGGVRRLWRRSRSRSPALIFSSCRSRRPSGRRASGRQIISVSDLSRPCVLAPGARCSRPPAARTSRSRRCGRAPGSATSSASTAWRSPIT